MRLIRVFSISPIFRELTPATRQTIVKSNESCDIRGIAKHTSDTLIRNDDVKFIAFIFYLFNIMIN